MAGVKILSRAKQNIKLENRKTVLFFDGNKSNINIKIPDFGCG